jgi:predicted phage tail protein
MYRTIHLHGALGEEFGRSFRLHVANPAEAVRALCTQLQGFERALRDGGAYRVVIGKAPDQGRVIGMSKPKARTDAEVMKEAKLVGPHLGAPWRAGEDALHIVPVVQGRKSGGSGIGKIIMGLVLVVATIFTAGAAGALAGVVIGAEGAAGAFAGAMAAEAFSVLGVSVSFGQIALLGAMTALGGIAQAISPQPKTGDYSARQPVDQRSSFLFNQITNTTEQGGAVPLIYGETMVGSVVIASGLAPEEIAYSGEPGKVTFSTLTRALT